MTYFIDGKTVATKPTARTRNLDNLLRLTLAAIEITSSRREALDSSELHRWIPEHLSEYSHNIYETSVVYEFTQIARHDFAAHRNSHLWERPIAWQPPGKTNWKNGQIDLCLFPNTSKREELHRTNQHEGADTPEDAPSVTDVNTDPRDWRSDTTNEFGHEVRIEFGKAQPSPNSRPLQRDNKLEEDALKLLHASTYHFKSRKAHEDFYKKNSASSPSISTSGDFDSGVRNIENFVILWEEKGGRKGRATQAKSKDWHNRCLDYAKSASTNIQADVILERTACCSLLTLDTNNYRSANAAIYSVSAFAETS